MRAFPSGWPLRQLLQLVKSSVACCCLIILYHPGIMIATMTMMIRPPTANTQPMLFVRALATHASSSSFSTKRIAVVGGGASGIFSAIAAAERIQNLAASSNNKSEQRQASNPSSNISVTVLEGGSQTLAKVKISGGGRCNVLHDTSKSISDLLQQGYPRGFRELNGVLHVGFSPTQAQEWFEQRGVVLKTEGDGRMFPTTDSSQTIIDVLLNAAQAAGVTIRRKTMVRDIEYRRDDEPSENNIVRDGDTQDVGHFRVTIQEKGNSSSSDGQVSSAPFTRKEVFDALILATGSAPIGYKLAAKLGHEIVPTVPSLFTINTASLEKQQQLLRGNIDNNRNDDSSSMLDLQGLAGVSVPLARVSFQIPPTSQNSERLNDGNEAPDTVSAAPTTTTKKKRKRSSKAKKNTSLQQEGPLLITHRGLSGPAILKLSAFGAHDLHDCNYRGTLIIHWAPSLGNVEAVAAELWKMTTARPKKSIASACPLRLPTGSGDGVEAASRDLLAAYQSGFRDGSVPLTGTAASSSPASTMSGATTVAAVPRRLWAAMTRAAGVPDDLVWGMASKKLTRQLAQQVCQASIPIMGKGTFKEEFVTAGGISLKQVQMKRMASRVCPGLFCCGEVINVDGVTGGYNFMNCWSTGHVAGSSAADYCFEQLLSAGEQEAGRD